MSAKNWWNVNINVLREELRKRGLDTYGSKPVMVRRLESYEENYRKHKEGNDMHDVHVAPTTKAEISQSSVHVLFVDVCVCICSVN